MSNWQAALQQRADDFVQALDDRFSQLLSAAGEKFKEMGDGIAEASGNVTARVSTAVDRVSESFSPSSETPKAQPKDSPEISMERPPPLIDPTILNMAVQELNGKNPDIVADSEPVREGASVTPPTTYAVGQQQTREVAGVGY